MEWIWGYIIQLSPIVMLIMLIVSLVFFFKSPTGSKKRKTWKILSIVFGVIAGLIFAAFAAILIIMTTAIEHM